MPAECWLYICKCDGILKRSDWKTLRLCCKYLRDVVAGILFRSVVVLRTAQNIETAIHFAASVTTYQAGIATLLTTLTVYGPSEWGKLTVTIPQLWDILTSAPALRTVVLATLDVVGGFFRHTMAKRRRSLKRFSFFDVTFYTPTSFIQSMLTVGIIDWLHLEHITFRHKIHCHSWVITADHLSLHALSWAVMGAFTSTFDLEHKRAERVKELDISFRYLAHAKKAFPLLRACPNLLILRMYFYAPSANSVHCTYCSMSA